MGRDQELKWLTFSLYPLSFFLYSPYKLETVKYFLNKLFRKNYLRLEIIFMENINV